MNSSDDLPAKLRASSGIFAWIGTNPMITGVVAVVAILGFISGFVFQFWPGKNREITYHVSAFPTAVVRGGQASDLKVSFKDKVITTDLSAIQVAIWNEGKEAARRESILSKTVTITLNPALPILVARIKKSTRSVINAELEDSEMSHGILHLTWDILEQGDGVLLEIIYAGRVVHVSVNGVIEGRVPIKELQIEKDQLPGWFLMIPVLAQTFLFCYIWRFVIKWFKDTEVHWAFSVVLGAVALLSCFPVAKLWYDYLQQQSIPFTF